MNIDLAIIGQGAVTPAGSGLEALRAGLPIQTSGAGLRRPDQLWPILRVDLKDPALARWQREPRLRRSSPLSLFLIEAADQALAGLSPGERAQTGLIIAFSAGCLVYSHRFFAGILAQGQRMASPALFPETVFNSPGSHVAATLGLNGAASALVGDEVAWVAALKTASIWMQTGRVRQVLVLGAEEFDPVLLDVYENSRWLRRRGPASGFLPAEGAAGLLLRLAEPHDSLVITQAYDGYVYRTKTEAACAAQKLLREINPALPCYPTARHTWLGDMEEKVLAPRPTLPLDEAPYLGSAFTASAAWNTLRALAALRTDRPSVVLPLWGLNHQLGALTLEKRRGF